MIVQELWWPRVLGFWMLVVRRVCLVTCSFTWVMGYGGLDINDYPYKPRRVVFVKRDVYGTGLPSNFFDAVVVVSTMEHIGLPVYGQVGFDVDGDVKAIGELRRILKPGGYLIITTPFAGRGFRIVPGERQYDIERLELLERGFEVVAEEFFISYKLGRRFVWVRISRDFAGKVLTRPETPGLVCLVLRKPLS